ncbi:MAG: hypothetical protein GY820_22550 [Gammaproteobacteria bacterium]|nr:hypothetical protein [Gammaproteobacteria bacterium]
MPAKKQFSFFAAQDDLIGVLVAVAAKTSYQFVNAIDIDDGLPSVYTSVSELPDLSVAVFGDQNKEKIFLLIPSGAKPSVRKVEQHRGGVRYFLDQLSHPESVVLRPGGVFGESECIIAGQVGTTSDEKWSVDLYKIFFSEFKKQFIKIKSFYVGKVAAKKLNDGVRLTTNVKAAREYDLHN